MHNITTFEKQIFGATDKDDSVRNQAFLQGGFTIDTD